MASIAPRKPPRPETAVLSIRQLAGYGMTFAAALLCAAAPAPRASLQHATLAFTFSALPYFPGSRIRLDVRGSASPLALAVIGPGNLADEMLTLPLQGAETPTSVVAAGLHTVAFRDISVVTPPQPQEPLLAVGAYDAGVVLHDPVSFRIVGTLGIGGSPSDVAFASDGSIGTSDTTGNVATVARRRPWNIEQFNDVPFANELVFDDAQHAVLVSNRELDGYGALTKIAADGSTTHLRTGLTAEGLALDRRTDVVYVGNVNDGSVLAVDARTLQPRRRITAVPRVFGLALSPDGHRLFAVANRTASRFGEAGFVAAIDIAGPRARVVARSADMQFPLGIALDAARSRVFVTDESANVVYVLDARTLRAVRSPLSTCRTPWKPFYDRLSQRLYIPCARADLVDVFDARTLQRIRGTPFRTGGFPLAVSAWRPA
jgi:hypothetical protein